VERRKTALREKQKRAGAVFLLRLFCVCGEVYPPAGRCGFAAPLFSRDRDANIVDNRAGNCYNLCNMAYYAKHMEILVTMEF